MSRSVALYCEAMLHAAGASFATIRRSPNLLGCFWPRFNSSSPKTPKLAVFRVNSKKNRKKFAKKCNKKPFLGVYIYVGVKCSKQSVKGYRSIWTLKSANSQPAFAFLVPDAIYDRKKLKMIIKRPCIYGQCYRRNISCDKTEVTACLTEPFCENKNWNNLHNNMPKSPSSFSGFIRINRIHVAYGS